MVFIDWTTHAEAAPSFALFEEPALSAVEGAGIYERIQQVLFGKMPAILICGKFLSIPLPTSIFSKLLIPTQI